MLIVILLRDGPLRFNALKRVGGGITQRMLTRTLRGLEHDGVVVRTVHPAKPPQVDYAPTRGARPPCRRRSRAR
jgi:DNA-binding HxlR family transcriptional regulator